MKKSKLLRKPSWMDDLSLTPLELELDTRVPSKVMNSGNMPVLQVNSGDRDNNSPPSHLPEFPVITKKKPILNRRQSRFPQNEPNTIQQLIEKLRISNY